MTLDLITSEDIKDWNSLDDISSSFEKRGFKIHRDLGEEDEILLEVTDDEFIALVHAAQGCTASDYKKRMSSVKHTMLVSTSDFKSFTFITRVRSWDYHGRIKYQQFSFEKSQFTSKSGEKRTVLKKLNELEYGVPDRIYQLYDTQRIVKEFYEQFETLRTKLITKVAGIPEGEGDYKRQYVQSVFDRLIFLYFIQKKNLLDFNPSYLRDKYEEKKEEGDVNELLFKPLFFKVLAEGKKDLTFGTVPYLNGGLFSKSPVEQEYTGVKIGENEEETNELFGEILDFLDDWNWYADERLDIVEPKNLSPEILGHIFEKTVNQKEMGAYYTPEEITHFMARNTIHPFILDRINEKFGTDYEEIDQLFGISDEDVIDEEGTVIGDVKDIVPKEIEYLYFDVLEELSVLDPAVGSGAFLLAAEDVLLDVYLSCIKYFRVAEKDIPWELTGKVENQLEKIEGESESLYSKRKIILNNLYGVDIDEGATEICKLRLWLSMVADIENDPSQVEPLPNIDFNIRQGNSLIGYTETIQKALFDNTNDGNVATSLTHFSEESIAKRYEEIIDAIKKHKEATSSKEANKWKKVANEKFEQYREDPDKSIYEEFKSNVDEDITLDEVKDYSPFHWVLEFAEVYSKGGFDVIIGNPPWNKVKPNKDEFFTPFDPNFSKLMPQEKKKREEELLSNDDILDEWTLYKKKKEEESAYYNQNYVLQNPSVYGHKLGSDKDLSFLFIERVFSLIKDEAKVSMIFPGSLFFGSSAKDIRAKFLENCDINSIITFENHGIFNELHHQYKFGIVTLSMGGSSRYVRGSFNNKEVEFLRNKNFNMLKIPKKILSQYSPKAGMFPVLNNSKEIEIISKIVKYPPISHPKGWNIDLNRELDRGNDREYMTEDKEIGDYPIYSGSNVYQFSYNNCFYDLDEVKLWGVHKKIDGVKNSLELLKTREKKRLKKKIYEVLDGKGSQKQFVNDILRKQRDKKLSKNDVKLDKETFRIGFRSITNSTNERTLISALIPPGILFTNTLVTIRPFEIEVHENDLDGDLKEFYVEKYNLNEKLVLIGLLNSIPFDFLMRTKIESKIMFYKLKESQMPRIEENDSWFEYICTRAAKLNCYGDEFEEMRESLGGIEAEMNFNKRKELQAEIDAAAFHVYSLNKEEVKYILESFYRVKNPRLMTEDYFEMVYDKYLMLKERGPKA